MNKTTSYNNSRQYNTNNSIKPTGSGYSGGGVFGIILLIVVILVVLLATYWAYNVYTKKSLDQTVIVDVMKDVKDATSKFAIGSGSVPSSKYSNEYSISMWINVQDYTYNYGKQKVILRRGDTNSPNIEIALGATDNDLIVKLKLQGATSNAGTGTSIGVKSSFENIAISNNNKPYSNNFDQPHINNNNNNNNNNDNNNNNNQVIQGTFNLQNTTSNLVNCNNTVFDKISGNDVTYETINYNNNVNGNEDGNNFMLAEPTAPQMKEGFNCCSNDASRSNLTLDSAIASVEELGTLYKSNIHNISDNSAPIETQNFNNEYFLLVSGNEVKSFNRLPIENFNSSNLSVYAGEVRIASGLNNSSDILTQIQRYLNDNPWQLPNTAVGKGYNYIVYYSNGNYKLLYELVST